MMTTVKKVRSLPAEGGAQGSLQLEDLTPFDMAQFVADGEREEKRGPRLHAVFTSPRRSLPRWRRSSMRRVSAGVTTTNERPLSRVLSVVARP